MEASISVNASPEGVLDVVSTFIRYQDWLLSSIIDHSPQQDLRTRVAYLKTDIALRSTLMQRQLVCRRVLAYSCFDS